MRVKINNGHSWFWTHGQDVPELNVSTDVMVAIDPSKSNMAIIVGTLAGQELALLELSGNDSSFYDKAMDTTDFTLEVCDFLRQYLKNATVDIIGIEQHILKKGVQYYNSMTVLTEIRAALINLALDLTKKRAWEINNSAWKGAILPDGYRGHGYKGSLRYLREKDPFKYDDYSDDATDVTCIFMYMVKEYSKKNGGRIKCLGSEKPVGNLSIAIMSGFHVPQGAPEFEYNPQFSIKENAIYFANRSQQSGVSYIPLHAIKVEDVYTYGGVVLPGTSPVLFVLK